MANKTNLRLYQEELLAKIQAKVGTKDTADEAANSRLGVLLGKDFVLVNLADISEVVPLPELCQVPMTKTWFLGLANIRGNLFAVNDLSQMILQSGNSNRLADLAKSKEARMLLLSDSLIDQVSLLVDRVVGLRQLNILTMIESKNDKPFYYKHQQYLDEAGHVWYELDIHKLIESKVFLQPSLV